METATVKKEFDEKAHRAFVKLQIRANKCVVGEKYYLTGMYFDYGDLLTLGVGQAVANALGAKMKRAKIKRAKCLINSPVVFNGKVPALARGMFGIRKGFQFEFSDGEKIHMQAHETLFRKKYGKAKPHYV